MSMMECLMSSNFCHLMIITVSFANDNIVAFAI